MDRNKLNPVQVSEFLDKVVAEGGEDFVYDEAKTSQAIAAQVGLHSQLAIKVLTIFGGILATIFFNAFLLLGGLNNSPAGMMVLGVLLIAGAIVGIKLADTTLAETACISFNIIGYMYFGFGFNSQSQNESALCGIFLFFSLAQVMFASRSIFIFIAVLIINGSLAGLILINLNITLLHIFIGVLAVALTYLSVNEPFFISKNIFTNGAFRPVRMGLVLSLIAAFLFIQHYQRFEITINHVWVTSVFLLVCNFYSVFKILQIVGLTTSNRQWLVYGALGIMLAPTFFTPPIAGAILIMLLGFYLGHTTSFGVGVVALIYFVTWFYYDLQLTLLVKSVILMITGGLFIAGYGGLQKITEHEAV